MAADGGDQGISEGLNLAGFLFGNVNERGELENSDLLDEVAIALSLQLCAKDDVQLILLKLGSIPGSFPSARASWRPRRFRGNARVDK